MCAACFTTPSTKETIKILTMGVLFVRKLYSLHLPSNVILLSRNRSLMTTKVPRSMKKKLIVLIWSLWSSFIWQKIAQWTRLLSIYFFGGEKAPIINLNVGRVVERLPTIFGVIESLPRYTLAIKLPHFSTDPGANHKAASNPLPPKNRNSVSDKPWSGPSID